MTIVIIEDHAIVAESIRLSLLKKPPVENVFLFLNAEAYLDRSPGFRPPDLIISDILMPGISGVELLTAYRKQNPGQKVIFLSSLTDIYTVRQAIRHGVNGYVSKDASIDELYEAITSVASGERYVSRQLQKGLLANMFTEEQIIFHLSPREKEVLHLVCSGHTIKEAAFGMGLSTHTVQSYHKNIMKKFKVHCTTDLIVFAIRNGLYNPSV